MVFGLGFDFSNIGLLKPAGAALEPLRPLSYVKALANEYNGGQGLGSVNPCRGHCSRHCVRRHHFNGSRFSKRKPVQTSLQPPLSKTQNCMVLLSVPMAEAIFGSTSKATSRTVAITLMLARLCERGSSPIWRFFPEPDRNRQFIFEYLGWWR